MFFFFFDFDEEEEIIIHFEIDQDFLNTQVYGSALIAFDELYRSINDVVTLDTSLKYILSDQIRAASAVY